MREVAVRKKSVIAQPGRGFRQDGLQKAANEFIGGDGHLFLPGVITVAAIPERHDSSRCRELTPSPRPRGLVQQRRSPAANPEYAVVRQQLKMAGITHIDMA
jgi:hypothetical protein